MQPPDPYDVGILLDVVERAVVGEVLPLPLVFVDLVFTESIKTVPLSV